MRKFILFILVIINIKLVSASIIINEIMYNPYGEDNNKEFIELFSDEIFNLEGYIIQDSSSSDILQLLYIQNSSYSLIVEEGFNYSGISASIYSIGSTIGNNLNNDEDSIILQDNLSAILDTLNYSDSWGADGNNNSLCRIPDKIGVWHECNSTPGSQNYGLIEQQIENNTQPQNNTISQANIRITEFLPNPKGDDDAPMPGGEFIELYNQGNDTNLAGYYIKDASNHTLYITDTTTNGTIIKAKSYLLVYTNGFTILNNEGYEEISIYDQEGNPIDKVSYAESKEGLSWSLVENHWQYRLPTPNKINFEEEPEMDSLFKIEKIEDLGSDDEAKFGDIVKVNFHVYKGDTSKSSVKLYIENNEDRITKITKASLDNKFTNYTLTLPLQIYPNCNEKFDDGSYYVKLGWTSESEPADEFKIKVNGINMDYCSKIYVEKTPRKGTLTYNLVEYPASAEIGEEFSINVELTNNDDNNHYVDLSSYVYRGSKSYSSSREENKKKVLVKAGETQEFGLVNLVKKAEPGEYKLKVKIKRDDQKTEKQITKNITLKSKKPAESSEKIAVSSKSLAQMQPPLVILNPKDSKIVYESTGEKTKKLLPYFMIALFAALLVILIIKNKEKIET